MKWFLYVLQCSDGTYYTGVTVNMDRRLDEHNNSNRGAKYTRARRPVSLIFSWPCDGKSQAYATEHRFKKLSRRQKEEVIKDEGKQKDFFQPERRPG